MALLLALAAADPPKTPTSIDGLPLGGLPPQSLPARGCAAYLFSTGKTRALVAVAGAEPGSLRLSMGSRTIDLARSNQTGSAGYGFALTTDYAAEQISARLDLEIQTRRDLTQGAIVDRGTLRVDRPGEDSIILPLAGLIGCATQTS